MIDLRRPLAALLLVAAGCSSAPEKTEQTPGPSAPEAAKPAAAAPAPKDSNTITVKKGDKSKTEAAYLTRKSNEHVSIDVKNADLEKVVLPIFRSQVNVWVQYYGPPRIV